MTGTAELAARARAIAAAAPPGSLQRKAAGSAAVALHEASSVDAARKILRLLWAADVRQAAEQLIDQLAEDVPAIGGASTATEGTT